MDTITSFLPSFGLIGTVISVVMLVVMIIFILSRYKTVSSNEILVKTGKVGGDKGYVVQHGGGTFIWPVIQTYHIMSMSTIQVDIPLEGALTKRNIRVNVPASFTFAIGETPDLMNAAAVRLLNKEPEQIKDVAKDIILGQLRATIANMEIEAINSDREQFEENVQKNIDAELRKVGLYLVNTNLQDINDLSGYLDALGQEAAAKAVNDAKVKVAASNRDGAQGEAAAKAEERRAVAGSNAQAVSGENEAAVTEANSKAEREVAEAEATRQSDAAKAVKAAAAQAEGYAAQQEAETARAERDRAQRYADQVVPAQIAAEQLVVEATAQKDAATLEAEAIRMKEAARLKGQAEGFDAIVKAAGGNAKDAAMLLIVDQMPAIVAAQAQAISNIEFDKVVVIGGGDNGAGGAADFVQSFAGMLPGAHALAEAAGINLPGFLGSPEGAPANVESAPAETAADDTAGDEQSAADGASEEDDVTQR